jgi:hypothetical protein
MEHWKDPIKAFPKLCPTKKAAKLCVYCCLCHHAAASHFTITIHRKCSKRNKLIAVLASSFEMEYEDCCSRLKPQPLQTIPAALESLFPCLSFAAFCWADDGGKEQRTRLLLRAVWICSPALDLWRSHAPCQTSETVLWKLAPPNRLLEPTK